MVYGYEGLSDEFRVRYVIEAINNHDRYIDHQNLIQGSCQLHTEDLPELYTRQDPKFMGKPNKKVKQVTILMLAYISMTVRETSRSK